MFADIKSTSKKLTHALTVVLWGRKEVVFLILKIFYILIKENFLILEYDHKLGRTKKEK